MTHIHPVTLTFDDDALETRFWDSTLLRTRIQAQIAMIVGMFLYEAIGVLDQWFVPCESADQIWMIRITAAGVPATVLILTFTSWFAPYRNILLALVGLAAGVGLISLQALLPVETSAYYYPMMVLVTFYTYNFIGTRFTCALAVDLLLLSGYNIVFGWYMGYPTPILMAHDAVIVSANLIGGTAGYLAERQRRTLFLREYQLEQERHKHLHRSLHDHLTNLPNRDLLYDRISQAIASARRDGSIHCGLFLDLDGFKSINDTLGHQIGDDVLKEIARRLSQVVRDIDTVARIGGDEFFILALDVATKEEASHIAKKILDAVNRPIGGIPDALPLGGSIGICMFPYEGMSVSEIINSADKAMYKAKKGGKGTYQFVT